MKLPTLTSPPRRVPALLWLRIMLGGTIAQGAWLGLAFLAWLAAIMTLARPATTTPGDGFSLWWLTPVVLLVLVILGIAGARARRQLRLLAHGVQTLGTLVDKKEVSNSETSYWHYTFEYEIAGGATHRATVITDGPEPSIEDEPREAMLYDPDKPGTATTLDHLPGVPEIRDGQLVARGGGMLVLVVPVLAIAGAIVAALA